MQVITIFNEKGGVGKTTLTGIIGAGLAMRGHKVLLIDADGQGDLTTNQGLPKQAGFFKFVKWGNPKAPDFVDVKQIVKRVPPDVCSGYLYIVPGNEDTWGIPGSMTLVDIVSGLVKRLGLLEPVFDYVLVDTQPSATTLHDGIGLVSDWFICPTELESASALQALPRTAQHIENMREQSQLRGRDKCKLMGIIPNKFRKSTSLHNNMYGVLIDGIRDRHGNLVPNERGEVFAGYGDLVWEPIPERINLPEAQLVKTTLMHDAPHLETNDYLWATIKRVEQVSQDYVTHG